MRCSELGEDLAIKGDIALLELTHDLRVAETHRFDSRADADLHQPTIITLLEFTVAVGVPTGFGSGNFREGNAVLATPHHALGTGQNILAALDAVGTALYTWHSRLNREDEWIKESGVNKYVERSRECLSKSLELD